MGNLALYTHGPSPLKNMHCLLSQISKSLYPACSKLSWKNSIKLILAANEYALLMSQCGSIPISKCAPKSITNGRIFPHWMVTKGDRQMLQRSNFRVRLLVNCDGLEADAAIDSGATSPHSVSYAAQNNPRTHTILNRLPSPPRYP